MKRVCHLTSVHKLSDTRILYKECVSLSKQYEVKLICFDDEIGKKNIEGIEVLCIDKPYKSRIKRIFEGSSKIYSAAIDVKSQIYHFHDPELIFVGLLLKLKGKKVIYDVHEDLPKQILAKKWIHKYMRHITAFVIKRIEAVAAHFLDAVVIVADSQYDRFARYNSNVVEIANYPLMKEIQCFVSGQNTKGQRNICYVGGITLIRGIQQMVNAVHKVANCKLILAGEFESRELEEQIKQSEGWVDVEYWGHIDRESIVELLSNAQLGLVLLHPTPNYIDADRPIKMYEYMAAGIPVLASHFPKISKFIAEIDCGKAVNPLDDSSIAQTIEWFFDNPQEMQRMGMNGRKAVIEKYNWDIEEKKLLALYKKLIEE